MTRRELIARAERETSFTSNQGIVSAALDFAVSRIAELEAEVEALRADKALLDGLERLPGPIPSIAGPLDRGDRNVRSILQKLVERVR